MDPAPRIDPLAQAFAGIANEYELGRPDYPSEPVDWAWERLGLSDSATVLDLAAGTGKLSRLLAPRAGRLIIVEPLAEMRRVLTEQMPEAEPISGTAEQLPLDDASVEAVFVAEAFHWFDGDRALREIHRVLRPGGGLAVIYGHSGWDVLPGDAELTERLNQVNRRDVRPENRPWTGLWRDAFERSEQFEPLVKTSFPFVQSLTIDQLVALVASWSFVGALPADERDDLLADVRDILRSHGDGPFDLPSSIDVYVTTRRR